jgi:hypothetical protein
MAEHNMSKQRTSRANAAGSQIVAPVATKPPRVEAKGLAASIARLEASVLELKRERDTLAAELVLARGEIAALDQARRSAIDRIDWVIDSLSGVVDHER